MTKIMILYVPVIHKGYLELLRRYKEEDFELFILGQEFIDEFSDVKEIRAIEPAVAAALMRIVAERRFVDVLVREYVDRYDYLKDRLVIISNDELSRKFAEKYLKNNKVEIDSAFLRWDEKSVLSKSDVNYDSVSENDFDRQMMGLAMKESNLSSDWWRHVGCALVKDGRVIFKAHNHHVPNEHVPYIAGDPRDFVKAGTSSELCSALHAEQSAIAWAANEGISLKGVHAYVTVFPCPVCAKLIAYSGISKVFYFTGHASLDGVEVLKSKGVEIVFVA